MAEITLTSEIGVTEEGVFGSDRDIAARAWGTAGKDASTATEEEVYRLLRMLMRKRHGSVFEFGTLWFRLDVPIFVARQLVRHRIGWSLAELSGRWHRPGNPPPLKPVFWVPRQDRPMVPGEGHTPTRPVLKPARKMDALFSRDQMAAVYNAAWATYTTEIGTGIAAEVARAVLPLATYTTIHAQCNPRSLMSFLALRTKSKDAAVESSPQDEIREMANKMEAVFARQWPLTHKAFVECGRTGP